MNAQASAFELYSGTLGRRELTVVSFEGREWVSKLFSFEIRFLVNGDIPDLEAMLLGAPAVLAMRAGEGAPRFVQGIAANVGASGVSLDRRRQMRLRLVPRLWLLKKRRTSRIFQDLAPKQIVDRVLAEHGIAARWDLSLEHRKRSYCVQYQESDFQFVSRLLAEEGIWYCFEPLSVADLEQAVESGGDMSKFSEQMLLCDHPERYPVMQDEWGALSSPSPSPGKQITPKLAFHALEPGSSGGEYVYAFDARLSVQTQSVHLRDYDFERPHVDLKAEMNAADLPGQSAGYHLEEYDHGGELADPDASALRAMTRLEQHQRRARLSKGKSNCRRISAGHRFLLEDAPDLNAQDLAVISVRHQGANPAFVKAAAGAQIYENEFEVVTAHIPYRPKCSKRRLNQVMESAVVVGPVGQEVHTDGYGRIKVQFQWDLDGEKNENSSCWMRVMQPWAGASWGTQFIPRVGMEVLVTFLGGDCDKPVVMGSVYNATHPPAFALPQGKNKSGIVTRSIGGQGSNEFSFDDTAGGEQVFLKAERDWQESVGRDHTTHVGGAQSLRIGGAQSIDVGGGRHDSVNGVEARSVQGHQRWSIAADQDVSIGGRKTERIGGGSELHVHGHNLQNKGMHSETVQGYSVLNVGTENHPTGRSVLVYGNEAHDASGSITLRSEKSLMLHVGESSLLLTPEGIQLTAKKIVIKGKESLTLLGDGPGIELSDEAHILADTIKLFSKGGSVELDSEAAHVDGPLVKLNCGAGSRPELEEESEEEETRTFKWKCLDADLEPYKNKTYTLVTQGFKAKGTTDDEGYIEEELPTDAFIVQIMLWIEDYPQGERRSYTIRLGDLPPASTVYGAQIRLKNLGYYLGEESDEINPEMQQALVQFQEDHGLSVTGDLDGPTALKFSEVHP